MVSVKMRHSTYDLTSLSNKTAAAEISSVGVLYLDQRQILRLIRAKQHPPWFSWGMINGFAPFVFVLADGIP
jgi:hypothetical protein